MSLSYVEWHPNRTIYVEIKDRNPLTSINKKWISHWPIFTKLTFTQWGFCGHSCSALYPSLTKNGESKAAIAPTPPKLTHFARNVCVEVLWYKISQKKKNRQMTWSVTQSRWTSDKEINGCGCQIKRSFLKS